MKSLLDSIRQTIYERLSSPLAGCFIASWICWNYRFLLILFSNLPVNERLAFAESASFPDWHVVVLRGILLPLVSAAGFILVYPWPSKWLYTYWIWREQKLKAARDEIEKATLLTLTESLKIKAEASVAQKQYEETVAERNKTIEGLNATLASVQKESFSRDQKDIIALFENSWTAKDADLKRIFDSIIKPGDDRSVIRPKLTRLFSEMLKGEILGSIDLSAWDFTPSAITYDGHFIYHPSFPEGQRVDQTGIMKRVLEEKNGNFIWINKLTSEQFSGLFIANVGMVIGGLNNRVTRVYFRDLPALQAIVVMECHVNVIDHLPKAQIMSGISGNTSAQSFNVRRFNPSTGNPES